MRWLNYQHLYYFWHIVQCGSITGAAQQLRLAQPTISAQLKIFEEVLGDKLFERNGRSLNLTEAGHIAYRYAAQIFSIGQELLDVLEGKLPSVRKVFNVGIADVVPKSIAYAILKPIFDADKDITIHCLEDKTDQLLAQLAISKIDLIIADRPLSPDAKVKAFNHFIGECGISILGAAKITKRHKRNFPRCLDEIPLLLPTTDSAVRNELDRWFLKIGINQRCVGEFQDRALMKLAAKDGKGVMAIPTVVEAEVRKEFNLELLGRTQEVKEQVYLISIERRLRNPLVVQICAEAQTQLFSNS